MRNTTVTAILLAGLTLGGTAFAQETTTPVAPDAPVTTAPDATAPMTPVEPVTPAPTETAPAEAAPAVTDAPAPAMMVPEGYTALKFEDVTADELKGVDIYDANGSSVAEVADLVIDPEGKVTGVVTDVGGFLGIGEHRISLSPEQITFYRNADKDLRGYVGLTKDALKALPAYTAP